MNLNTFLKDDKIRATISESWSVSWPMILIMFFESLIGLTDVYVAGKFGKEAQAAYGVAFQLYFIFIIIGMALGVGAVSVIARLFTSDRREEFGRAVNSSLAMSAITGSLFGILGLAFSRNLVDILNIPHQLKVLAIPFIMIYSLGFLFDYILITTNGILRACNMIKKSLITMSVVCVLNVAFNFLLPFRTPLGFKGIAAATVISLFTGSIINMVYVRRVMGRGWRLSVLVIRKILNISWPAGLLQVLWQLGSMALFLILSLLPEHNIEIMAALTNGLRIESAIFLPAFAFNMANAVVVGNLLGKDKKDDAVRGGLVTAVTGVVIVAVLTIIIMLNARHIASFLSGNDTVISESVRYIYIALIFEPLMAWGVILGGGLNGAGDTRSVMTIIAAGIWLVRIPLSYFLGIYLGLGAIAVWWSMNLSILTQTIFISMRYFGKRWVARGTWQVEDI